jgi:uncharacterized integral membrane protein (TIGR02327 family)
MNAKLVLYIVIIPFVLWSLNALNISNAFKKNKINEARILYIMITISLSYLLVNFIYDFFEVSKLYQ